MTAGAFVVAWLAIAGIPPFSGFWAKDDVLAKAFYSDHYGLWAVGLLAAILTGPYMTRQVWLTFYGNERFELAGADDRGPAVVDDEVDVTATPTVAYGDPVGAPARHHAPHESGADDGRTR